MNRESKTRNKIAEVNILHYLAVLQKQSSIKKHHFLYQYI